MGKFDYVIEKLEHELWFLKSPYSLHTYKESKKEKQIKQLKLAIKVLREER